MELKWLFRIFLRWLWLILLIPLVTTTIAAYVSLYRTIPEYQATASLFIVNSSKNDQLSEIFYDISDGQAVVRNYSEIIKSRAVLQEAMNRLNMKGLDPGSFIKNVNVGISDIASYVISISVRNRNPILARDLANTISDVFINRVEKFMDMQLVQVLDKAELPEQPVNINLKKNIVLGVFAGLFLSLSIIFIVEYLNSTIISNEDDVRKHLSLPVFGIIPKRSGKHPKQSSLAGEYYFMKM